MFTIAICDDQNEICLELLSFIHQYEKKNALTFQVDIFHSAEKVIDAIESGRRFDLLFLDIELKQLNGVELGIRLREQYADEDIQIVYISAKETYALSLFQVRPLHFLVKPLSFPHVTSVIELAIKLNYKHCYYHYKIGRTSYKKQVQDILYFESAGRQIQMVTHSEKLLIYDKMEQVAKQLKDFRFLWIHKSILVNYQHIITFAYDHVVMSNGTVLSISQSRRSAIRMAQLELEKESF